MNATHQRKVLLMNSRNGELYNVEGVITSIMFSSYYYLYINLLETQLRTSLAIVGDIIVSTTTLSINYSFSYCFILLFFFV